MCTALAVVGKEKIVPAEYAPTLERLSSSYVGKYPNGQKSSF